MILRIRDLPDPDATRSGDGLLDHVGPLTAAHAAEKRADAALSAIRGTLALAVKAEEEGSPELDAYLFPDGVTPVIQLQGRAQLAQHQAWALLVATATATANPAYARIAALVQEFLARLATFAAALQEKEVQAVALTAARAARNQEREAWNETFTDLIWVVGAVHGLLDGLQVGHLDVPELEARGVGRLLRRRPLVGRRDAA